MAKKLRRFVHVRADGNQVFYRGHSLTVSEDDSARGCVVEISLQDDNHGDVLVGVVRLADSESVGEYFSTSEEETKEKKK